MVGIDAARRRRGHRSSTATGRPVKACTWPGAALAQRAEDVRRDVPAGARAQVDRHRLVAVEDRALRRLHREGAIAAGIAAHVRRQHAFQRIGRVRRGVVERAVQPALRQLRRRALEVELDRVALDGELRPDSAAACRADCSRPPTCRRRRASRGSRRASPSRSGPAPPRRARRRSCMPYSLMNAMQALGADRVGGDERMDVAEHLRRDCARSRRAGGTGPRSARPRRNSFIGGIWMPSS